MVKTYQFKKAQAPESTEFEAAQWDGTDRTYEFLRGWTKNKVQSDKHGCVLVQEANHVALARPGDYIRRIPLVSGEYAFSKVAESVFNKLYREAK